MRYCFFLLLVYATGGSEVTIQKPESLRVTRLHPVITENLPYLAATGALQVDDHSPFSLPFSQPKRNLTFFNFTSLPRKKKNFVKYDAQPSSLINMRQFPREIKEFSFNPSWLSNHQGASPTPSMRLGDSIVGYKFSKTDPWKVNVPHQHKVYYFEVNDSDKGHDNNYYGQTLNPPVYLGKGETSVAALGKGYDNNYYGQTPNPPAYLGKEDRPDAALGKGYNNNYYGQPPNPPVYLGKEDIPVAALGKGYDNNYYGQIPNPPVFLGKEDRPVAATSITGLSSPQFQLADQTESSSVVYNDLPDISKTKDKTALEIFKENVMKIKNQIRIPRTRTLSDILAKGRSLYSRMNQTTFEPESEIRLEDNKIHDNTESQLALNEKYSKEFSDLMRYRTQIPFKYFTANNNHNWYKNANSFSQLDGEIYKPEADYSTSRDNSAAPTSSSTFHSGYENIYRESYFNRTKEHEEQKDSDISESVGQEHVTSSYAFLFPQELRKRNEYSDNREHDYHEFTNNNTSELNIKKPVLNNDLDYLTRMTTNMTDIQNDLIAEFTTFVAQQAERNSAEFLTQSNTQQRLVRRKLPLNFERKNISDNGAENYSYSRQGRLYGNIAIPKKMKMNITNGIDSRTEALNFPELLNVSQTSYNESDLKLALEVLEKLLKHEMKTENKVKKYENSSKVFISTIPDTETLDSKIHLSSEHPDKFSNSSSKSTTKDISLERNIVSLQDDYDTSVWNFMDIPRINSLKSSIYTPQTSTITDEAVSGNIYSLNDDLNSVVRNLSTLPQVNTISRNVPFFSTSNISDVSDKRIPSESGSSVQNEQYITKRKLPDYTVDTLTDKTLNDDEYNLDYQYYDTSENDSFIDYGDYDVAKAWEEFVQTFGDYSLDNSNFSTSGDDKAKTLSRSLQGNSTISNQGFEVPNSHHNFLNSNDISFQDELGENNFTNFDSSLAEIKYQSTALPNDKAAMSSDEQIQVNSEGSVAQVHLSGYPVDISRPGNQTDVTEDSYLNTLDIKSSSDINSVHKEHTKFHNKVLEYLPVIEEVVIANQKTKNEDPWIKSNFNSEYQKPITVDFQKNQTKNKSQIIKSNRNDETTKQINRDEIFIISHKEGQNKDILIDKDENILKNYSVSQVYRDTSLSNNAVIEHPSLIVATGRQLDVSADSVFPTNQEKKLPNLATGGSQENISTSYDENDSETYSIAPAFNVTNLNNNRSSLHSSVATYEKVQPYIITKSDSEGHENHNISADLLLGNTENSEITNNETVLNMSNQHISPEIRVHGELSEEEKINALKDIAKSRLLSDLYKRQALEMSSTTITAPRASESIDADFSTTKIVENIKENIIKKMINFKPDNTTLNDNETTSFPLQLGLRRQKYLEKIQTLRQARLHKPEDEKTSTTVEIPISTLSTLLQLHESEINNSSVPATVTDSLWNVTEPTEFRILGRDPFENGPEPIADRVEIYQRTNGLPRSFLVAGKPNGQGNNETESKGETDLKLDKIKSAGKPSNLINKVSNNSSEPIEQSIALQTHSLEPITESLINSKRAGVKLSQTGFDDYKTISMNFPVENDQSVLKSILTNETLFQVVSITTEKGLNATDLQDRRRNRALTRISQNSSISPFTTIINDFSRHDLLNDQYDADNKLRVKNSSNSKSLLHLNNLLESFRSIAAYPELSSATILSHLNLNETQPIITYNELQGELANNEELKEDFSIFLSPRDQNSDDIPEKNNGFKPPSYILENPEYMHKTRSEQFVREGKPIRYSFIKERAKRHIADVGIDTQNETNHTDNASGTKDVILEASNVSTALYDKVEAMSTEYNKTNLWTQEEENGLLERSNYTEQDTTFKSHQVMKSPDVEMVMQESSPKALSQKNNSSNNNLADKKLGKTAKTEENEKSESTVSTKPKVKYIRPTSPTTTTQIPKTPTDLELTTRSRVALKENNSRTYTDKGSEGKNDDESYINIGRPLNITTLEAIPGVTLTLKTLLLNTTGITDKKEEVTKNIKNATVTTRDVPNEVVRERIRLLRLLKEHKSFLKGRPTANNADLSYLQVSLPVTLSQILNGEVDIGKESDSEYSARNITEFSSQISNNSQKTKLFMKIYEHCLSKNDDFQDLQSQHKTVLEYLCSQLNLKHVATDNSGEFPEWTHNNRNLNLETTYNSRDLERTYGSRSEDPERNYSGNHDLLLRSDSTFPRYDLDQRYSPDESERSVNGNLEYKSSNSEFNISPSQRELKNSVKIKSHGGRTGYSNSESETNGVISPERLRRIIQHNRQKQLDMWTSITDENADRFSEYLKTSLPRNEAYDEERIRPFSPDKIARHDDREEIPSIHLSRIRDTVEERKRRKFFRINTNPDISSVDPTEIADDRVGQRRRPYPDEDIRPIFRKKDSDFIVTTIGPRYVSHDTDHKHFSDTENRHQRNPAISKSAESSRQSLQDVNYKQFSSNTDSDYDLDNYDQIRNSPTGDRRYFSGDRKQSRKSQTTNPRQLLDNAKTNTYSSSNSRVAALDDYDWSKVIPTTNQRSVLDNYDRVTNSPRTDLRHSLDDNDRVSNSPRTDLRQSLDDDDGVSNSPRTDLRQSLDDDDGVSNSPRTDLRYSLDDDDRRRQISVQQSKQFSDTIQHSIPTHVLRLSKDNVTFPRDVVSIRGAPFIDHSNYRHTSRTGTQRQQLEYENQNKIPSRIDSTHFLDQDKREHLLTATHSPRILITDVQQIQGTHDSNNEYSISKSAPTDDTEKYSQFEHFSQERRRHNFNSETDSSFQSKISSLKQGRHLPREFKNDDTAPHVDQKYNFERHGSLHSDSSNKVRKPSGQHDNEVAISEDKLRLLLSKIKDKSIILSDRQKQVLAAYLAKRRQSITKDAEYQKQEPMSRHSRKDFDRQLAKGSETTKITSTPVIIGVILPATSLSERTRKRINSEDIRSRVTDAKNAQSSFDQYLGRQSNPTIYSENNGYLPRLQPQHQTPEKISKISDNSNFNSKRVYSGSEYENTWKEPQITDEATRSVTVKNIDNSGRRKSIFDKSKDNSFSSELNFTPSGKSSDIYASLHATQVDDDLPFSKSTPFSNSVTLPIMPKSFASPHSTAVSSNDNNSHFNIYNGNEVLRNRSNAAAQNQNPKQIENISNDVNNRVRFQNEVGVRLNQVTLISPVTQFTRNLGFNVPHSSPIFAHKPEEIPLPSREPSDNNFMQNMNPDVMPQQIQLARISQPLGNNIKLSSSFRVFDAGKTITTDEPSAFSKTSVVSRDRTPFLNRRPEYFDSGAQNAAINQYSGSIAPPPAYF